MSTAIAKRNDDAEVQVAPAPASETAAIFSMIERVAADPSVSVERVEQLFGLYQRMQADRARKEFAVDLIAAQSEMEPIRKDATNSQTKSRYATFDALDRAIRPIYTRYGFAPTYHTDTSPKPDHVMVVMTLLHRSGYERLYTADMPADGKGAKGGDVMTKTHAFGSAFSYGKRYTLGGAFNVVTTERDDDGNDAGGTSDGPISESQLQELIKLADEVGADKAKFCRFYNITSFAEIQLSQFEKAKNALKQKARHAPKK